MLHRSLVSSLILTAALMLSHACADDASELTGSDANTSVLQALSAAERNTCMSECVAGGGDSDACATRCGFVEDAFGACFDDCLNEYASESGAEGQCRERCSDEWRDALPDADASTDMSGSCVEDCVERGGDAQGCRDTCQGEEAEGTSSDDVGICIEQCMARGGSPEGCREACS